MRARAGSAQLTVSVVAHSALSELDSFAPCEENQGGNPAQMARRRVN